MVVSNKGKISENLTYKLHWLVSFCFVKNLRLWVGEKYDRWKEQKRNHDLQAGTWGRRRWIPDRPVPEEEGANLPYQQVPSNRR